MDYSILFTSIIYLITMCAVLIITNIPAFIGIGGGIYVLSKICYAEEDILIGKDFSTGLKRNLKQSIQLSLLFSLTFLFSTFVVAIYLIIDIPLFVRIASNIIAIVLFIIVSLVVFIALNYMNVYKVNFFSLLKNSFLIGFSSILKTIAFYLLSTIVLLTIFIPMRIPIFPLINIFFGFSYFLVIEVLYSTSLFDKYINSKAHPELVDKGMRKD